MNVDNSITYLVYDAYGEVRTRFNKCNPEHLKVVILNAWNYEAMVTTEDYDLIFDPHEELEFTNDVLGDHGLEIIELGKHLYLREKATNAICILQCELERLKADLDENSEYTICTVKEYELG